MKESKWATLLVLAALAAAIVPAAAGAEPRPRAQDEPWAPFPPPPGPGTAGPMAAESVPVGWVLRQPSPAQHMDSAVLWAPQNGGLWVVSGLFTAGATQRYDPPTDTWTLGAIEPWPAIQEPVDGCYGVDAQGHEVIVLFPDTTGAVVGSLHVFDVTANAWSVWPTPPGFPPGGQWAHDIVSMLPLTSQDVCYLSGGATWGWPGGGNLLMLWAYSPASNTITPLGNFNHIPGGFNWHASWWVPWVGGSSGAICVGGGVDTNLTVRAETQCYDLAGGTFLPPNVPLGPLPVPLGGMADGWKVDGGQYQIWLANGLDPALNYVQISAWADATTSGFQVGPPMAAPAYRTEGDGVDGHLYAEGGSFGLFTPRAFNQLLVQDAPPLKLHVGAVRARWRYGAVPGLFKVLAIAKVHNQLHQPEASAVVSGDYLLPDGSLVSLTRPTAANGVAKFPLKSMQVGVHTFCVTGIAKAGTVYDPAANHMTCTSLQVGP